MSIIDEALAELRSYTPFVREFEEWQANKAKALAEVAAAKAEAEKHRSIRRDHEAAISELHAEKEKLRGEIAVAQSDLHRIRKEFDYWATEFKDFKRRNRME